MTELYLGGALLLLMASLFFLFPGWFMRSRHRQNLRDSNLEWYHLREQELAGNEDADALLEETRLRLLEDEVDEIAEEGAFSGATGKAWLWLLPVLVISFPLYHQLGSATDVSLTHDLDQLARSAGQGRGQFSQEQYEASYMALMQRVEQRAAQRPDNLHYQAMLGRYYMNRSDYGAASKLYLGLAERTPNDATALAMAAQAGYMAAGRQLNSNARMLAQKALAVDPHQATALGLLGMSAYEQGQYQAAINYWNRLIVMQDPNSESAQMIRGIIARAQQALGEAPQAGPEVAAIPAPAVAGGLGVTVSLSLPVGAEAGASDSVFVFARNPESGSRMPVAVKRLTVADLPATLRLDDAASMAGQKISELAQVLVVARVSPSGQPGEQFATFQGSLGPLPPEAAREPRALQLKAKKI